MIHHPKKAKKSAIFKKYTFIGFLLCLLCCNELYAQTDSVYWSFGTSGNASASATSSSYAGVPAAACLADTGNVSGPFTSASGYSTLYFTTQFPSSGYPAASGEPTMRNNTKAGSVNAATSTFFSFTISPTPGATVEIKQIHFAGLKGATGPTSYTIRTSLDGYTANIATGSFSTSYGSAKKAHTGLSLQGSTGTAITVRIYVHNPVVTSTGGNVFIDDVVIYYHAITIIPPGVSTGTITNTSLCTGANVNVPYAITGVFNSGNVFTAQLSDANGSFASPVNIGTLNSTNSGSISAAIPPATLPGTGYRIRVISSNPALTGSDNGTNINMNATVVPTVTITPSPGNMICAGSTATFTATITNGGSNPFFQWKKNSSNVGTNNNVYSDNNLLNGDAVTVELTSNATCATPSVLTATAINMIVNSLLTPSVNIAASTSSAICQGDIVSFTATPVNEGATPVYQWKKNSLYVGANSATYTDNTWANGDIISLEMTSSIACVTAQTVISNAVVMNVSPSVVPGVSIAAQPGNNICDGQLVTFAANPVNGGTAPVYQWKINGGNVGTNSNTFTSNNLSNGNMVTVDILSNATCAVLTPVPSNAVKMVVAPTTPPVALLTVQPADSIMPGQTLTFTLYIADGGSNPVIHWLKNGVEITGVTGYIYTTNSLGNGDQIKCFVKSSNVCAAPDTTTSNAYVIKYIGTGINGYQPVTPPTLYPNPNDGTFIIDAVLPDSRNVQIDIYNNLGQAVYHSSPVIHNGRLHEQFSLNSLPNGNYWINLRTDIDSKVLRFTIQ
jgi:hypothetical protein